MAGAGRALPSRLRWSLAWWTHQPRGSGVLCSYGTSSGGFVLTDLDCCVKAHGKSSWAAQSSLWFCFFLCPPSGAGRTDTSHVLTCAAGTSSCLQTINEYWFAALLPFKEVKLPYQLLRGERGSLIWFWLLCWVCVQLLGSLLFVHS